MSMGFDFGAGERRLSDYTRRVTAIQEQAEETQARVRTLRSRTTSADQCIRPAVENPAAAGEFRMFGYLDNVGEYSPDGLHPVGYPCSCSRRCWRSAAWNCWRRATRVGVARDDPDHRGRHRRRGGLPRAAARDHQLQPKKAGRLGGLSPTTGSAPAASTTPRMSLSRGCWPGPRSGNRRAGWCAPSCWTAGDGYRGPRAEGRARAGDLGDPPVRRLSRRDRLLRRPGDGPRPPGARRPARRRRAPARRRALSGARSGLASTSAADRRAAATAVASHAGGGDLDAGESSTIATVLAWAVESPRVGNRATAWRRFREISSVRPVLLSALLVFAEDGRVPVRVLDRMVTHLAGVRLDRVDEGFCTDLTAALRRSRG